MADPKLVEDEHEQNRHPQGATRIDGIEVLLARGIAMSSRVR